MRIAKLLRTAPLAACVLLAGCDPDSLPSFLGGARWRMVEAQDQLTGQTQSHAELSTELKGGGHARLEARCGGAGAATVLLISGEISAIGPLKPLDQVSRWRAAAGGQEGDLAVTMTGQDSFTISVPASTTATVAPDDMNGALFSTGQTVRAEMAREGEDPVLNFRNTDDAFQAMARRCRLRAEQSAAAPALQPAAALPAEPTPLAGGAEAPVSAPASPAAPAPPRMAVAPANPNSGPAPLPPNSGGQIAPLPPGASQ